jgi:hypothetical protein
LASKASCDFEELVGQASCELSTRKNISVGAYQEGNKEVARMANQCLADAAKAGITRAELEEEIGTDLFDHIGAGLKAVTNKKC